jgi:hypothetical protein
MKEGVGKEKE